MRNRAFLKVALLGLLALALVPGLAAAGPEMLASQAAERATAVSGPILVVSPLSHDFGLVLAGGSASFDFAIMNTGDADLNLSGTTTSDPALTTSFGSAMVPAGGSTTMTVVYAPTSGAALGSCPPDSACPPTPLNPATIAIHSDATNGDQTVNVTGRGNTAPTLTFVPNGDPPDHSYTGAANTTLSFDVTGNDAESDPVTLSATGLPPGATFNSSNGHFEWALLPADAGDHDLTICGTDGGATTCEAVHIHVTAENLNAPVANPGGPYQGGTGQPVQFDGSGSFDPDGTALTYAWIFGDGGTGSGVKPTHIYSAAGEYLVSLTVTDSGNPPLHGSGLTSATILNTIPVDVFFKAGKNGRVRTYGGGVQEFAVQNVQADLTKFDGSTFKLLATVCGTTQVSAFAKGTLIGDLNNDGIPDVSVSVKRSDLDLLVGCAPNNSLVTITVTGLTTPGSGLIPIQGSATIKVGTGGAGTGVRAFASPNPFNPETVVNYSLRNSGNVSIRIYSLQGRLVRTLFEGYSTAGTNEVRWNGRDNNGNTVSSGLYFVKVQQGSDSGVFKVAVTK